jgi:hypothetical protein
MHSQAVLRCALPKCPRHLQHRLLLLVMVNLVSQPLAQGMQAGEAAPPELNIFTAQGAARLAPSSFVLPVRPHPGMATEQLPAVLLPVATVVTPVGQGMHASRPALVKLGWYVPVGQPAAPLEVRKKPGGAPVTPKTARQKARMSRLSFSCHDVASILNWVECIRKQTRSF